MGERSNGQASAAGAESPPNSDLAAELQRAAVPPSAAVYCYAVSCSGGSSSKACCTFVSSPIACASTTRLL
jgi:hypothetical protein